MPEALTWAILLVASYPLPPQPHPSVVLAGPALSVLVLIVRCTPAAPSGNAEETSFIPHRSWRVHGTPGATQQGRG